jgi:antitoxin CptB
MTLDHDTRLKRLKFRAWHRGFREADLILGPFADTHAAKLTPEQCDAFETLLEEQDWDLYAWILGRAPTPPEFDGEILDMIKAFRLVAHGSRAPGDGA